MAAEDFRAARAKLRLRIAELARLAGVSVPTVIKVESDEGHAAVRPSTLARVKAALTAAGAVFDEGGAFQEPFTGERGPADPFTISAGRFRQARARTRLTSRELMGMTGLTAPTLKAIERGRGPPRVSRETVLRIVEAYKAAGYCFCANPAADYLDREVWAAWRRERGDPSDEA